MTEHLTRPGGTIAFDVQGVGPLVVCVPGMGDLRSSYRHTVPALVAAGHRVATFDLRGHGESATTFDSFDDSAAASDLLALIDTLGDGPAAVLGNSMTAAAAVIAATDRPDAVSALVLIGPFVRNPKQSALTRWISKVVLRGFWGRAAWRSYFGSLTPSGEPADTAAHQAEVRASLARPDQWRAFQRTAASSHAESESRLSRVSVPSLVVMGSKDRDFPEPAAEAAWIAGQLGSEVLLVDGAGHYPMAEQPAIVNPAVVRFLAVHVPGRADA